MLRTRVKGFTLLELMVTIAVFAILVTIAVPAYRRLGQHSAITATANSLVATLHFARTQAVKRDHQITVCHSKDQSTCSGSWNDGWIVGRYNGTGVTGKSIQVHQRKSTGAQIKGYNGGIVFGPNGFAFGHNGSFSVVGKNYRFKTCVIVAQTGRIRTLSGDKGTSCSTMGKNPKQHQHTLS